MVYENFEKSIVYPFLSNDSKLMVCSYNYFHRTRLVLKLCVELLNPSKDRFLGAYSINKLNCPNKILWIYSEPYVYYNYKTLDDLIKNMDFNDKIEITNNLIMLRIDTLSTASEHICESYWIEYVHEFIKRNGIDLVVLDSLSSLIQNKISSPNYLNDLFYCIDKYIRLSNLPLIYTHEAPLNGKLKKFWRGSKDIYDYATDALYIYPYRYAYQLKVMKNRFGVENKNYIFDYYESMMFNVVL